VFGLGWANVTFCSFAFQEILVPWPHCCWVVNLMGFQQGVEKSAITCVFKNKLCKFFIFSYQKKALLQKWSFLPCKMPVQKVTWLLCSGKGTHTKSTRLASHIFCDSKRCVENILLKFIHSFIDSLIHLFLQIKLPSKKCFPPF
jgi:hypothetical protein